MFVMWITAHGNMQLQMRRLGDGDRGDLAVDFADVPPQQRLRQRMPKVAWFSQRCRQFHIAEPSSTPEYLPIALLAIARCVPEQWWKGPLTQWSDEAQYLWEYSSRPCHSYSVKIADIAFMADPGGLCSDGVRLRAASAVSVRGSHAEPFLPCWSDAASILQKGTVKGDGSSRGTISFLKNK